MKPPELSWNAVFAASVRGSAFVLAVLTVGVVFGAEEKRDAAPVSDAKAAAEAPSVAAQPGEELPAWARGWVVASVTIPKDGEIKDATVDFQMPNGEPATLVADGPAKGGVALESIVWEGTPVRARLRLRQGRETADLFGAAALIAKSKVQKKERSRWKSKGCFLRCRKGSR